MQDNGYRIIKLKNGENLISKLIDIKKRTIILERPMQYKIVMLVDNNSMKNTEMLVFKTWLEYSTDIFIEISADGVLAISIPDEKLIMCYEMEKQKEDTPEKEIPLQSLENIAQQLSPNPTPQPDTVNITFNVPQEMAEEIIEMMSEAKSWEDLDEELEDEDLFPEVKPPKKKTNKKKPNNSAPKQPPSKKNKREAKDFGNDWNDWSPDPKDYI